MSELLSLSHQNSFSSSIIYNIHTKTMANKNSTTTDKSKAPQASVQPKDAVRRRRMNIQMVQNVLPHLAR